MRWVSHCTAYVDVAMAPAWVKRASVVREANSVGSQDVSVAAYTLNPSALASSAENITHTLVHTQAMKAEVHLRSSLRGGNPGL